MASAEPQHIEQLRLLQERFPQERRHKLSHLLGKFNGSADLVRHFSRVHISSKPANTSNAGEWRFSISKST